MDTLKKFGIFLLMAAAVVGAGSSLGWLLYHHEWFAAVGDLIVIAMAVPMWMRCYDELMK